jgi:hypothetical protein
MEEHSLLERRERITVLDHGTPEGHRAIDQREAKQIWPPATDIIISKMILQIRRNMTNIVDAIRTEVVRGLSSGLLGMRHMQFTFNVTGDVSLLIKALFSLPVNSG